ncbi:MAG: peptidoglycan DD-metalloendopeptidase family protein [Chitinophagales bacterium]
MKTGSKLWKPQSIRLMQLLPVFTFGLLLISLPATAQQNNKQKKEQLEKQMKKLQDEIKLIESAIKANSAKKEKNQSEILSLQAKIKSREKLIGNMSDQIGELDEDIDETQQEIENKTVEVDKMKAEYAKMLRKSYENITLQNQLTFILSSNSFFDAVRRYNYLQKIADYRKSQAKAIQQYVLDLQAKRDELQDTKEQKETLLEKQTRQKEELENEKKEKDNAVAKLLEKEKKLRKQADEKNKAAQQLNARIQAIIEDEIRQAKKKAEEQAKKNPGSTNTPTIKKNEAIPMTPEERALSASFEKNMGKLPWPVLRGHIVSEFGVHEDPLLAGVKRNNNGIDIKTEPGADARSVFGGTVISVFYLPTIQNCIIVKHGEYFSVYSNIETASVKANDVVTTKQTLGKLHTEKSEDLTKVHLEIWKGKEKMDPALWLAD